MPYIFLFSFFLVLCLAFFFRLYLFLVAPSHSLSHLFSFTKNRIKRSFVAQAQQRYTWHLSVSSFILSCLFHGSSGVQLVQLALLILYVLTVPGLFYSTLSLLIMLVAVLASIGIFKWSMLKCSEMLMFALHAVFLKAVALNK